VIPKIRCGACLYLTPRRTCNLTTIRTDTGEETANPHLGAEFDPHTNPGTLVPPCRSFFWRYRRTSLEGVAPAARAPATEAKRRETADVLDRALVHLLRSGPTGRRQAFILSEHFTNERPATAIAADLGVSERTVRRDISAGLASMHQVLTEKFGLGQEDIA
jgi:DNA-directed RNA polymerase specialized sigma24 family protein